MDLSTLDFTNVPLWIQFWGLPLHCKSLIMGHEMGAQLGSVLDVGIYEFPENAKAVKVKILFNRNNPIRAGMWIGNDLDGTNWVDFRYENLPMFCFSCGLIGHNMDNCKNTALKFEGGVNPRGAWLRSRNYGRRIVERKENTFSSNPLKSLSGSHFSPKPKGLLSKMAALNINKNSPQTKTTNFQQPHPSPPHKQYSTISPTTQKYQTNTPGTQVMIQKQHGTQGTQKTQALDLLIEDTTLKRKLQDSTTSAGQAMMESQSSMDMAGLNDKASQAI